MSLSSVNLLWQTRLRGLLPVPYRGVDDDGRALLIKPDDLERRCYQVLSLDRAGAASELCALSVETVHRFDALPGGRLLLAMTADDLYLFRDGKKLRVLVEQRVTYADASLAPETGWFVCGFANTLLDTHAIAFGDANGRLGWTKDISGRVSRVAISADGRTVAVGLEDGRVLAMDSVRSPLWETPPDEPVTALALPRTGPRPVAGTSLGSIVALGADGGVRWRSTPGLPVLSVALDGDGACTAVAATDGTAHLLVCLGSDGAPLWELELPARPTGIALSPNGRYLAVSTAGGIASLFECAPSEHSTVRGGARGVGAVRELAEAREAAARGEGERAADLLAAAVRARPHDAAMAEEWLAAEERVREAALSDARLLAETGRHSAAVARLEALLARRPWDEGLVREWRDRRRQAIAALAEEAAAREAAGEWAAAAAALTEQLALSPEDATARQTLLRVREAEAAELTAAGDRCRASGDPTAALALWQQAREIVPSEELDRRLREAELERCLSSGTAYYEAGRMPEAAFQFRKALALDPQNEQARRYLGYAEGAGGDTLIHDRFARLE